ncbi:23S rRNA (uracil(1939)-C(5))-methyltransferase RlmD [Coriobacteriales bacterium OH1046]|nr:23S rRNA (uracil(1939)-C(5))-methyltransferase RlmD [Coriobacteriales bacterium OH1046]
MGYRTYTCPIAKACGGCAWLAVPYPIQLERKQRQVEELLGAMAGQDGAIIERIAGMDEPRAYRHKAATPFAPGGTGGGQVRSGFYAQGTHRIVSCEGCLVEKDGLRRILNDVASLAQKRGISPYNEDRHTGHLRHAIVRAGYATDDVLLTLVTREEHVPRVGQLADALAEARPELTGIVQNINDKRTNALLGRACHTLWGSPVMYDELLGCRFAITATSFYQTNPAQTELLYRLAIEGIRCAPGGSVLDAYCGCGTIGICAAAQMEGIELVGVERDAGGVAMARANAKANGMSERVRIERADATAWITRAACDGKRFDTVILDPPRAGSTPAFIEATAALAPERVVYVSCNPVTQARDLVLFRKRGYRLARVSPVDMFPHTKHVETVCLLTREQAKEHL